MSEEEGNVAEEIQAEEVVSPQEEISQANQAQESQEHVQESSDKEKNFARLRETKEQLERENRELKAAMQNKSPPPEQKEEDFGIDDDDLVEGKVVKKLYQEIRSLQSTYEQEKLASIPDRLRSKFSDFDSVVSTENIEKLKESEPELYGSIVSGNDLYGKGVAAYKTLKALGIYQDPTYNDQKKVVQQNTSRPLSTQAVKGQGALAEANIFAKGLTPELRKQLQQEMSSAVKAR